MTPGCCILFTIARYYLSTSAAILSIRVMALLTILSLVASEAPCTSAIFWKRLSVICSREETTYKKTFHLFDISIKELKRKIVHKDLKLVAQRNILIT